MRFPTLLIAVSFLGSASLCAQQLELPQNPLKGQIVFEEKKCIECHSIGGYGGTEGPDLGREQYFGSILELASII